MINMRTADIMTPISSDVEKSEIGAGVGEIPDTSFYDIVAADASLLETAVDGRAIAPLAARTLAQALRPTESSEIPAMRNISRIDESSGQTDVAQDALFRPLVVPVDQAQMYSSVLGQPPTVEAEASMVVRTDQTRASIEHPIDPFIQPRVKDSIERSAIHLTKPQTTIHQTSMENFDNIDEPEAGTPRHTKLSPPVSNKVDAPEIPLVLAHRQTNGFLSTPPKPDAAQQATSVEQGENSAVAADIPVLQSQRLTTGIDASKPADHKATPSAQDQPLLTPTDGAPFANASKLAAPKTESTRGKQHRFNDAPTTTPQNLVRSEVGAFKITVTAMSPHSLDTNTGSANVAFPLLDRHLAKTPKTSIAAVTDTPPKSSTDLNTPNRPQALERAVMSSRNSTPAGSAIKQSAPNRSEPPPPANQPIAHTIPAATVVRVHQPLLQTQVVPSFTSSQPKAAQPVSSENIHAAIQVAHTPAPYSALQQLTPVDAPALPVPTTETMLLNQIESLETPDLFAIETRHTDSASIRPETITARPEVARHVAQQLANVARQMPDSPIELSLNPEELGRVRLTFTMSDGGINVAVIAERGETVDLMRRHIETLAQEFRDMGYRDVNFEFSHNGQGGTGAGDTNRDRNANSENPPTETLAPVQLSLEPSTGLDLRL